MGSAFGVYGPVIGLSAMLGPIVAGGLIGLDLLGTGWRMIFLVNVPVGAFALLAGWRLLPDVAPVACGADRGRLDLAGVALAGTGMFMLVFPLVQGRSLGWPAWVFVLLAGSVVVLAVFARDQVRRKRSGATPLVEPSIFGRRAYVSGILFSLVFVGSLGGIIVIFSVLLQVGLGFSPWHSALTTAPWAAGAFAGSAAGGIAMQRFGRRVLQVGLAVETIGLLGIYVALRAAGPHVGSLDLLAPMIAGGVGMGMVFVPLFDIVMAGVEPYQMGSASSVLGSVNGLATSLGVAGLGAMFFAIAGPGGAGGFVNAAEWTALATTALLACAFAVAYLLPRRAREAAVGAGEAAGAAAEGAAAAVPAAA
jgi:hypothetical protein